VKPLRYTVPLGASETPASFASRTAALYGLPAREFCLDFGTTFQKVVDGEPTAIAIVAAKGGVPAAALAEHAFLRGEKHRYVHLGEALIRGALRRQAIAVCPRCLAEDIATSQSPPNLAPFGRAIWQIAAVKTCAVHGIALSIVVRDLTPGRLHDFAHHIAGVVPNLDHLVGRVRRTARLRTRGLRRRPPERRRRSATARPAAAARRHRRLRTVRRRRDTRTDPTPEAPDRRAVARRRRRRLRYIRWRRSQRGRLPGRPAEKRANSIVSFAPDQMEENS
jgi:TniQ